MMRPKRWHKLRDEKTGRFTRRSSSSAAVKEEVSPPPGFVKTPALKKKAIPAAPTGLNKKAAVITRKEKHLAALMKEKQLGAVKKNAKLDMRSSSATALRAAGKKPALVLAVDSDSEEEGEPMEARRKERKATQVAVAAAPSSSPVATRAAATKMCNDCLEGGARTCCLWLRGSVNCGEVGGSSSTHGQVRTYQLPLSTMHEALDATLKPIMKTIGGLQRSVDELKKHKAENEEKEKCLKKNLDDLGDQLVSVVQNVHDLQSKL